MKRKKTASAVEFKSIFEMLGMDENEDPTEGKESYGAKNIIEDIKASDFMLNSVNRRLDDYVRDYEKDPSSRAMIETAYSFKINVLADMAKLVMPLTSYGKDRLKEIKKCGREYESFVSPLITRITPNNIDSFSKVLTEDLLEDVKTGRLSAIGAVRDLDEEMYGAGAVVYTVDKSPFDNENVGRILWLYVHEQFREQGVGDHMLGELIARMLDQGIEYITINGPTGDDITQDRLRAYLMSSWTFELETTINPDGIMRVGDIKNVSRLKDMTKGVRLISDLKDGLEANVVKNALKRLGRPGYLSNELLSSDYIDPDLSFYIGTETTISALLLAHRTPSGRIRVEYLKADMDSDEYKKKLLSAFFKNAAIHAFDDTLLYIPLDSEEIMIFIEEICPIQMAQYMLEGLLAPPISGSDVDIDAKKVEMWISGGN